MFSTVHAHLKGLFVSIHTGGLLLRGTHTYKREEVKQDVLQKFFEKKVRERYPTLDDVYTKINTEYKNLERQSLPDADPASADAAVVAFQRTYGELFSTGNEKILGNRSYARSLRDISLKESIEKFDLNSGTPENQLDALRQIYRPLTEQIENAPRHRTKTPAEILPAAKQIESIFKSAREEVDKDLEKVKRNDKEFVNPDKYTGDGEEVLHSPMAANDPDREQDNWETVNGTENFKGLGLVYGIGAGYFKDLGNENFAGGEVYVSKPSLSINVALKIPDKSREYGKVEIKPGLTYGVSAILGKALNPGFAIYTRAGMEITAVYLDYTVGNDSPRLPPKLVKESFRPVLKPFFGGAGIMLLRDSFIISAEFNVVEYGEQIIRDFDEVKNKDYKRRRGYVTASRGYRLVCRITKTLGNNF